MRNTIFVYILHLYKNLGFGEMNMTKKKKNVILADWMNFSSKFLQFSDCNNNCVPHLLLYFFFFSLSNKHTETHVQLFEHNIIYKCVVKMIFCSLSNSFRLIFYLYC